MRKFCRPKKEIIRILKKDKGEINNIDIIEIPEAIELKNIKARDSELLTNNEEKFTEILSNNETIQIKQDINNIELKINSVSGNNLPNFSDYFKSSEDFKIKIIDQIKIINTKINKIEGNYNFLEKDDLLKKLDELGKKAFKIFNMQFDMENLKKKANTMGVNDIDLINLMREMMPGSNRKR